MIYTEEKHECVFHIVKGNCSVSEVIDYVKDNCLEWVNRNVLWDFTDSTLSSDIPSYNILKTSLNEIRDILEKRAGNKTACVVTDDATFATIRMAITAGEYIEQSFKMCVFRNFPSALEWLS